MNQDTFSEPYVEYPYPFASRSNMLSHPLDELEEKMNKILEDLDDCLAYAVKVTPELISNRENHSNEIIMARRFLHTWVEKLNNVKLKDYYNYNDEALYGTDSYENQEFEENPRLGLPNFEDNFVDPNLIQHTPSYDDKLYNQTTEVCYLGIKMRNHNLCTELCI